MPKTTFAGPVSINLSALSCAFVKPYLTLNGQQKNGGTAGGAGRDVVLVFSLSSPKGGEGRGEEDSKRPVATVQGQDEDENENAPFSPAQTADNKSQAAISCAGAGGLNFDCPLGKTIFFHCDNYYKACSVGAPGCVAAARLRRGAQRGDG